MGIPASFAPLDHLLEEFCDLGVPGIDCAVYHHGRCVYRRQVGFRDLEQQIPMDGSELLFLYSCSKPITCTAALQLVEAGLLDLDAPLWEYMPEFRHMTVRQAEHIMPAEGPILVRHLMSMSAGFTYRMDLPCYPSFHKETQGRCPTTQLGKFLSREPLAFHPGSRWEYSVCHDVLAALVETVSAQRFSDYVDVHIFRPLEMTRSTFRLSAPDPEQIATQYTWKGTPVPCEKALQLYALGTEYESGGAGCVSCVDDMMRFAEALRTGGTILKPETIRLLAGDQTTHLDRHIFDSWGLTDYGYGLGVRCPRAGGSATDFGWDGAAGSLLAIDQANELTFFYAQHMLGTPAHINRLRLVPLIRDIVRQ